MLFNRTDNIPDTNKTITKHHILFNKKQAIATKATKSCASFTNFITISFLYLSIISPAIAEKSREGSINTAIKDEAINNLVVGA